jgi:2-deoxy-D-gluconate 3-dehydrogenase
LLTSPKRDLSNLETKKAVEALGREAAICAAGLSSPESVASIVPTVLKDGHTIQILINCAGINRRHLSHQFPDKDWNEVSVILLLRIETKNRLGY